MEKEATNLELAQKKVEMAVEVTNQKIDELGKCASVLDVTLNNIQSLFDRIRNVPSEKKKRYEKLKTIRVKWKQQVEKIEAEYNKMVNKATDQGAAGITAGVAVAALAPTVAMGIATTFGVASTGTAISALSGAAATNAALAWLGGGAIVAGGGGMAAGSMLLSLAGPVGWAIAIGFIGKSFSLYISSKNKKGRLENIYARIYDRDRYTYQLAFIELCERIKRIEDERIKLQKAIVEIETFGTDYNEMTENQQYKLGTYVNLMESTTMLLVNPIIGLQPKYTEEDFEKLCEFKSSETKIEYEDHKKMIIFLANLLFKIELDEKDKEVLVESFNENEDLMKAMNMSNEKFVIYHLSMVEDALKYNKYYYRPNVILL